jgi:hypothetical protein
MEIRKAILKSNEENISGTQTKYYLILLSFIIKILKTRDLDESIKSIKRKALFF